jgi:hypothetical protein
MFVDFSACAEAGFSKGRRIRAQRRFSALVAQRHGGPLLFPLFTETAMIAPNLSTLEEVQNEFAAFLPELSSRLSCHFRRRNPEAREDAVAEGIGTAWRIFLSARMGGKTVTAGNLAFYAGRLVDSGRKVAGATSTDALSEGTLARIRMPEHVSLDAASGVSSTFCMVFGDRRWRWPVLDYVAPSLDWKAFEGRCCRRDRRIIRMRRAGWRQTEIASMLGISPPAVNQRLRNLLSRWQEMTAA